jgi:hypothetical protein
MLFNSIDYLGIYNIRVFIRKGMDFRNHSSLKIRIFSFHAIDIKEIKMQHQNHNVFVDGIHKKLKVKLTFFSKEDGQQLVRICAPMDFGPSSRAKVKVDRYHLWDYESDTGPHTLSLLPNQIKSIETTVEDFDPGEFVTWIPNWIIERDWGQFS